MKREFLDYIEDIARAISNVASFTEGMSYEDFVKDNKTNYAVVRALEIIGEAVRKVPLSVRNRYPEIPWKEMAGMRDKLIHEYFGVNPRTVWDTVQKDIPPLESFFQRILEDFQEKS
jgi:uncharacterized protein with HEPN domain